MENISLMTATIEEAFKSVREHEHEGEGADENGGLEEWMSL